MKKNTDLAQRRSRIETAFDILLIIQHGESKPTRIMALSNVGWDRCLVYLAEFEKQGLVTRQVLPGKTRYHLTAKGREAISKYLELKKFFEASKDPSLRP